MTAEGRRANTECWRASPLEEESRGKAAVEPKEQVRRVKNRNQQQNKYNDRALWEILYYEQYDLFINTLAIFSAL